MHRTLLLVACLVIGGCSGSRGGDSSAAARGDAGAEAFDAAPVLGPGVPPVPELETTVRNFVGQPLWIRVTKGEADSGISARVTHDGAPLADPVDYGRTNREGEAVYVAPAPWTNGDVGPWTIQAEIGGAVTGVLSFEVEVQRGFDGGACVADASVACGAPIVCGFISDGCEQIFCGMCPVKDHCVQNRCVPLPGPDGGGAREAGRD